MTPLTLRALGGLGVFVVKSDPTSRPAGQANAGVTALFNPQNTKGAKDHEGVLTAKSGGPREFGRGHDARKAGSAFSSASISVTPNNCGDRGAC